VRSITGKSISNPSEALTRLTVELVDRLRDPPCDAEGFVHRRRPRAG
jgi:hypothetical protein